MVDNITLLVLRFEGALQSWGDTSKWDYRDSSSFPSKSGIVGMLGCALGLERSDCALFELSENLSIAVRSDRSGERIIDFQTITGNPLKNAAGKARSLGNTFISNRVYLQDACFTVFIKTDESRRKQIINALRAPKWCIYLGRKSCVPSRPVLECEAYECRSLTEAVYTYPMSERAVYPVSFEIEEEAKELSSYTRPDLIMEGYRNFYNRRVWRGIVKEGDRVFIED